MTTDTQTPNPTPPGQQAPPLPQTGPTPTPDPRGTSPLAVIGLVLAFLLPLIGAVLSVVALTRTGPGKHGGRGLAIAGAIIGTLLTIGGVVALVMTFVVAGAAVEAADDAATEFEQELAQLDEELSSAFQDKAAVDAGEAPDFSGDVTLGAFTADEFGGSVDVTITNGGDVPYSYTVTIGAVSPDGATQYDTAVVFADELAPGQTSVQAGAFFTEIPADARFELVDYSRASF